MRLSEYMAEEETSLVTFHLCILQHHPWGWVGSQRAVPGDQFQISSQCVGQGYDLNINPSMFAGYGRYGWGGGGWVGGGEERSHVDICANSAKKGQTSTLGYEAWVCLPKVFYHWTHFTEIQLMSQHSQGRNNKNTQTDAEQISICVGLFSLTDTHQTQRKGDNRRHVKVMLKKNKKTVIQAERE